MDGTYRRGARVEVEIPIVPQRIAAAYLCVSEGTLENWRISGRGPAFVQYGERGGPVFYRLVALDEFIAAHERAATTTAGEKPPPTQRPEETEADVH